MEQTASDLSARLLATENLSVVRARTRTASFDIVSRVLTLPIWKNMTPEIEDMLVGHEVAHALYTTDQYMEPILANPKLKSYMNILEDVRIEKLIKRKYPGLRKRMFEGYRQLNERDFFGVKQIQSFDNLLLIDKINLYFKAGYQCGVTFSADEKVFVHRAEHTETIDEVIQLANDIYDFSKKKSDERKENQPQKQPEDVADEEDDDTDYDYDYDLSDAEDGEDQDEIETPPTENQTDTEPENESELEAQTDKAFEEQLEQLADTNTVYKYYTFDTNGPKNTIVPYSQILEETHDKWEGVHDSRLVRYTQERAKADDLKAKKDYDQFKIDSSRAVSYLVKEFEMKKSAQMLSRAQTSKIGSWTCVKCGVTNSTMTCSNV